jgi:hypothetical protein
MDTKLADCLLEKGFWQVMEGVGQVSNAVLNLDQGFPVPFQAISGSPVDVYLHRLASGSRQGQEQALDAIAKPLNDRGRKSYFSFNFSLDLFSSSNCRTGSEESIAVPIARNKGL